MKTRHVLVLEFETDKPIPDLTDIFADRLYRIDGVVKRDVTCSTFAEYVRGLSEKAERVSLEDFMRLPLRDRMSARESLRDAEARAQRRIADDFGTFGVNAIGVVTHTPSSWAETSQYKG